VYKSFEPCYFSQFLIQYKKIEKNNMIQNLFRKIVQFNKSQIMFATLLKK
jgi:hypothetical protein